METLRLFLALRDMSFYIHEKKFLKEYEGLRVRTMGIIFVEIIEGSGHKWKEK